MGNETTPKPARDRIPLPEAREGRRSRPLGAMPITPERRLRASVNEFHGGDPIFHALAAS
jgi:hypothetical protein